MEITRDEFTKRLRRAIHDSEAGTFKSTISDVRQLGSLVCENPVADKLFDVDYYALYAFQLLEHWVDSHRTPWAYDYIAQNEWPEFARSLLADIDCERIPSHRQWNNIFTLKCPTCRGSSQHVGGRIVCQNCDAEIEFVIPK